MEKFLPLIPDLDTLGMIFGIGLALIGVVAPRRFFGFETDWRPATSGFVVLVGIMFVAFSFPQLRFWKTDSVNVDRAILAKVEANSQKAIDGILSARSGNSYPWCFDKASTGLGPLNENLTTLKQLTAKK